MLTGHSHGKITFSEVLESAEKLSPDEKETLLDILRRRLSERI
jgi:hypothetical protein